METKLTERLVTVLREEGFQVVEDHASEHTFTASAHRGDLRVVIHATDREFRPASSLPRSSSLASADVLMRAGLPAGVLGPVQLGAGIAGAGGEAVQQRPTRRTASRTEG